MTARAALAHAIDLLDAEKRRLGGARAEVVKLTAAARAADPDDARAFSAAVAARDAARGRVEMLEAREADARAALARAQAAHVDAERAERQAALAELDKELLETDAELTRSAIAMHDTMVKRLRAFRGRLEHANAIQAELGAPGDGLRGTYWGAVSYDRVLFAAANQHHVQTNFDAVKYETTALGHEFNIRRIA